MDEVEELDQLYHLSYQEKLQLSQIQSDLIMWQEGPLASYYDKEKLQRASSGKRAKLLLSEIRTNVDSLRREPTDYEDFIAPAIPMDKYKSIFTTEEKILGRCPCPTDGELTRCCNLRTLDAVQQCAFACSYCAVQSFYNQNEIRVVGNLAQRMETLQLDEDIWHIGTGQSSDSLLWGNDFKTLDALGILARRYPNLVIELKTKCARTDWIGMGLPRNIIATWSLNAPTIIQKEEHLTASLEARLQAARKAADHHILIGFHLHPLVYFKGWEEAYRQVVRRITELFTPQEVILISFGTLTFTKSVLKTLRSRQRPSRILDMELTPFANKFSYPKETKLKLFKNAYEAFPPSWKQGQPFFYLCFEDPSLWQPVLGHSYPSNKEFESAMKESYLKTINNSYFHTCEKK